MSLPTFGLEPPSDSDQPQPDSHSHSHSHSQSQSQSQHQPEPQSQLLPQPSSLLSPSRSSATTEPRSGGNPLPISLRRSIQPNPSPTSLVPSTAEGKPIPVDDSTVEYRTTALRELNHNFPSHRYAKSTGAQNSTYSEPVIVRSYYPPLPSSRPSSSSRGPIAHGSSVSGPGAGPGSQVSRFAEAVAGVPSRFVSGEPGMLSTMVLSFGKKPVNGRAEDEARLPPVEAFSFKSFMANIEAQGGGVVGDINADLDRIAEICARSRYSLSNQYEVHYTPHGDGASFFTSSAQLNDSQGPTLQAVSADDEHSVGASTRRRRRMARRNSRAVGTLETIISSSRSSDEEQPGRKKAAAEIAGEIRGRAVLKGSGHSSHSSSSSETLDEQSDLHHEEAAPKKSSSSLALIDASTRLNGAAIDSPRTSATGLVSEPARPQESTSQLEIRTALEEPLEGPPVVLVKETPALPKQYGLSVAKGAITHTKTDIAGSGILSMINGWMPWKPSSITSTHHNKGLAEGSLRDLLKVTDYKGKGILQ
ncbi:uncharacterized protein Triagg1_6138 [Trichoderma aggressivum f. europaeum]|uniref:Uncharacterized protein n=1 Tax=Trichoderma aggressivum f. europaeum TaxID=173218 RepID=A0AAE1J4T9_9HYPO|nr:hypothetical protein Triagg1_6138 [Trichoderma aggressivum f. europaeum]